MKRLVHILNLGTLKVIYFVHFHSLISYGIIFWGNSPTMHKVFLIQKRILRIMLGLGPRCSYRRQFVKLHTLPVPSLYVFLLIMFVHNNMDNFKTNSLIHNFNTRSKNQLHLPTVHLACIQEGVKYSALRIFNALPTNLLQLQTHKVLFKLALRKYLLVSAFCSVDEFLVHSRNTVILFFMFIRLYYTCMVHFLSSRLLCCYCNSCNIYYLLFYWTGLFTAT
jgi:hypothetical protein